MTSAEYGRRITAIRGRTERYITNLMKRHFAMQMADVNISLERGEDPFKDWSKWDRAISDRVEPNVRAAIKAAQMIALAYMGTENNTADLHLVFRAGEVMRRLDNVNDTTKKMIESVLSQPVQRSITRAGQDMIDSVVMLFRTFISSRAPAIGLTVATASTGSGVDMAMKDEPQTTRKRWRAFIDEDTRPAHIAANGQTVLEHESFIVDGESLRWPGDPYGSPGNIINCRCYVEPII